MWNYGSEPYDPDKDPEIRRERDAELKRKRCELHKKDREVIGCLLASLTPFDAERRLVSFTSQRYWRLPRRSRPVDPC